MKHIKRKKARKVIHYSIRRQFLGGLLFVFSLFILLISAGSAYFTSIIHAQTYADMKGTLVLYENQMEKEFNTLEIYLYGSINDSTDLTVLDESQFDTNYYISMENIQNSLNNMLPCFAGIDGLFVYSQKSDVFIYSASDLSTAGNQNAISYLRDLFRSSNAQNELGKIDTHQWFIITLNNSCYFVRVIRIGNSYIGAWASTQSLLSIFDSIKGMGVRTMFLTSAGKPLGENAFSHLKINPLSGLNSYKIVKDSGVSYLMITDRLDYGNCYLMTLVPEEELSAKLASSRIALFVIGGLVLLLGAFLTLLLSRYLARPLKALLVAMESLQAGKFNTKVDSGNVQCDEFIQVNNAFNNMVDEIHELKIDVYEEQLDRKQMELKYLKSQIAPHFLINCLNTIYYLSADPQNHEIIRKMTVTLSDHLRYTLANRPRVKLSEELSYVTNYLDLSNLRFPGCMHYEEEIDPLTRDAAVFPLLVLMFAENTVKFELVMGTDLRVWIRTRLINGGNGPRVHLTFIDSGSGFSPEFLEAALRPESAVQQDEEGHHIGIANVIRRLHMEYGDEASILFSNEPEAGARIDIEIPYQPFEPPDADAGRDGNGGPIV